MRMLTALCGQTISAKYLAGALCKKIPESTRIYLPATCHATRCMVESTWTYIYTPSGHPLPSGASVAQAIACLTSVLYHKVLFLLRNISLTHGFESLIIRKKRCQIFTPEFNRHFIIYNARLPHGSAWFAKKVVCGMRHAKQLSPVV